MADHPVRVAIIGGGCAGMAAAWELSKQQGFEIHVYEKSWRLGGKAASVRAKDGRILEHGLHVWLGFYENAFRMMRECYAEVATQKLGPAAERPENKLAHGAFEDAFIPEPNVAVGHPNWGKDRTWAAWSGLFPPEPGLPGEPLRRGFEPIHAGELPASMPEPVEGPDGQHDRTTRRRQSGKPTSPASDPLPIGCRT